VLLDVRDCRKGEGDQNAHDPDNAEQLRRVKPVE